MKRIKPYFFVAPAIVWLLAIYIYPIIRVISSSFVKTGLPDRGPVNIFNYSILFTDIKFWYAFKNNLLFLLTIPVLLILSLLLSVILFERLKGWQIAQGVLLLPFILAIPFTGIVFTYLLQYNGTINEVLRSIGLGVLAHDWLVEDKLAIPAIMGVVIWRDVGFGTVLFLSRLMSIDESVIEASMIDGAGWWQRFIHIFLPQMRSIIEFFVVIESINMLGWMFDYIYVMTSVGGQNLKFSTLDFYVYAYVFAFKNFGVAYAACVILLLISIILVFIRSRVTRNLEEV
jgi:ABC-type sugar transport system permease subunit